MNSQRLLVVDDEPFNLEIIGEYLDGTGLPFDTACDGEEAWSMLTGSQRYAAVLLDRMMPVLDGMALLRRMKEDARLQPVPVIMQTAAGAPDQVREGLAAGAYYYLVKPYERDSLLAIVRGALADEDARRQLQTRLRQQGEALKLLNHAEFTFRTIEEAEVLAAFLASADSRPEAAVLGISELLVNAVEHGNLGITYAEKAQLKRDDRWGDEVAERLRQKQHADKFVHVSLNRDADGTTLRITDRGNGFDWQKYLDFDPARAFDPNGRGIALARTMSFASIQYEGCGNTVVARLKKEE